MARVIKTFWQNDDFSEKEKEMPGNESFNLLSLMSEVIATIEFDIIHLWSVFYNKKYKKEEDNSNH